MSAKTNYTTNKEIDWFWRGQSFTAPATLYYGLMTATKGLRGNSTAYSVNDTIGLTANDGNLHVYMCTTAGTSASSQGSLYPGVKNEVITDGTAVFTEQYNNFKAASTGTTNEVSGGAYARVGVTASLANFAGTQGSGTTTTSTGTSATTSNNSSITFPTPTANWGSIVGIGVWDAATSGNLLTWSLLTIPKTVNNGDPAPYFPAAAFTYQEDN